MLFLEDSTSLESNRLTQVSVAGHKLQSLCCGRVAHLLHPDLRETGQHVVSPRVTCGFLQNPLNIEPDDFE